MKYLLLVIETERDWLKKNSLQQFWLKWIYFPICGFKKLKSESVVLSTGDVASVYFVSGELLQNKRCQKFFNNIKNEFDSVVLPYENNSFSQINELQAKNVLRLAYAKQMFEEMRMKYVINEDNMHVAISANSDSEYLHNLLEQLKYCARFFSLRVDNVDLKFWEFIDSFIADNGIDLNASNQFDKKVDCDILVELGSEHNLPTSRQAKGIRLMQGDSLISRKIVADGIEFEGIYVKQHTKKDIILINKIINEMGYYKFIMLIAYFEMDLINKELTIDILNDYSEDKMLDNNNYINSLCRILGKVGIIFSKCTF